MTNGPSNFSNLRRMFDMNQGAAKQMAESAASKVGQHGQNAHNAAAAMGSRTGVRNPTGNSAGRQELNRFQQGMNRMTGVGLAEQNKVNGFYGAAAKNTDAFLTGGAMREQKANLNDRFKGLSDMFNSQERNAYEAAKAYVPEQVTVDNTMTPTPTYDPNSDENKAKAAGDYSAWALAGRPPYDEWVKESRRR
jgi:outer membrane cobalamin receptor